MRLPCWLRRVVGDPYRHAVEKRVASMAWRSTRRFSRTRRKILISTQVPQFAIAHCSECVFRAGATPDVTVARDLEVLAYHALYTKPWIGRKYAVAPALRDCEARSRSGRARRAATPPGMRRRAPIAS